MTRIVVAFSAGAAASVLGAFAFLHWLFHDSLADT
jgi:hypothetical protein